MPGTMPVGLALALAFAAFILGGRAVRWLDRRRVRRGEANTADGLGRDYLTAGPPTGLVASRLGLPSWVHLHTRLGRVDRDSGLREEVPVVVKEVPLVVRGVASPTGPDAVGFESGRVVMPIARAQLWGDREEPLPKPVGSWQARAGTAVGRSLRTFAIALLLLMSMATPPLRRRGGRHRNHRKPRGATP